MDSQKLIEVSVLAIHDWLIMFGEPASLEGSLLVHASRGKGELRRQTSSTGDVILEVHFKDGAPRKLSFSDLKDVRTWKKAFVPSSVAKQLKRNKEELLGIPEQERYRALLKKHDIRHPDLAWLKVDKDEPVWRFFEFLTMVDQDEVFYPPNSWFDRLEELRAQRLLANLYERRFLRTGNAADAARASRKWRLLKEPEHALRATEPVVSSTTKYDRSGVAAVLLTRAATMLDLNRHTAAEELLKKARAFGAAKEHCDNVWHRLDAKADK